MAKNIGRVKPVSFESDTFSAMKEDLTKSLNRLLRLMQRYGENKAAMTLKVTVTLEEQELDDGNKGTVPKFEHKVTTTVQRKDTEDGKLPGEWVLSQDASGNYNLLPLSGQMDMFEEPV